MALSTQAIDWLSRSNGKYEAQQYEITNAIQLYEGQYVQLDSGGRIKPFAADAAGVNGARALGRVIPSKEDTQFFGPGTYLLGDTTKSPPTRALVMTGGEVLRRVTVTGGAGTIADVGLAVYLDAANTAGDRTLVTSSVNNGKKLGTIVAWLGSTTYDVEVLSAGERSLI